ncbi:MAG: Maf family protein [Candidatus Marinimicrobia bacterium]|nr:Maf family protein [Candidatus Neomarinimicrobiota bacterium]
MIVQPDGPVILASASPRRKELLEELGLKFKIIPPHIDESLLEMESPIAYVCRLAEEKGQFIAKKYPDSIVISADTIVIYHDHILGKPVDETDAFRMLKMLSGNTHEVITAYSILLENESLLITKYERTEVNFRKLGDEEIQNYIAGGSPMDKAGAYGIQDLNTKLVESINGCFYNVIGFPVTQFKKVWDRLFVNGNR